MTKQNRICFVAINRETCDRVAQQLSTLLGNFIQVDTWCLREPPRPEVLDNDIFIISTHAVWQQVSSLVPPDKRIIVASRTLEIDNLEELLALSRGTEALILSNHEKTALEIIEVLKSFAIDNVVLHPRWPDKKTYPRHIKLAITAGQQPVPPEIERVIDLGVRTLNLSTLVELIIELDLPREIVNEISARYISAIISILPVPLNYTRKILLHLFHSNLKMHLTQKSIIQLPVRKSGMIQTVK